MYTVTNAILAAAVSCANFTTRAVLHDCMYTGKIIFCRYIQNSVFY